MWEVLVNLLKVNIQLTNSVKLQVETMRSRILSENIGLCPVLVFLMKNKNLYIDIYGYYAKIIFNKIYFNKSSFSKANY